GATGQHRLGVPALDDLGGLADAVAGRRAGADDGVVGTAGAGVHGHDAGGHVRDHHRHGEGGDPAHAALHQRRVALFDLLHAADAAGDDDAHVVGIHVARLQAAFGQGLLAGRQGELAVAADVAGRLAVHVELGVEVLDLGRDAGAVGRGVEGRDLADARRALVQVRLDRFDGV